MIQFPCLSVKLVPICKVEANGYNPNKVATQEMRALETSIKTFGVTLPIVVSYNEDNDIYTIIDGFHRYTVLKSLSVTEIPVVVLELSTADKYSATVLHNEARGKHDVQLDAHLLEMAKQEGLTDAQIRKKFNKTNEELYRLRVGIKALANKEYSKAWEVDDE